MKQTRKRQLLSALLVWLTLIMTILSSLSPMLSYAAQFSGRNIWKGGAEEIFGENRAYLYRWSDGFQSTFCIEPGRHMSSEVHAYAGRYHIEDDNIPYINGKEDFQRLALICDWYDRKAGAKEAPNDAYAAAQVAVWAVVSGQWENAALMGEKVHPHISGNVNDKMGQVLSYVETAYSGAGELPDWCAVNESMAPVNNMTLVDGQYQIEFDFSACPEIADVSWELPAGFNQMISDNTLTLTYHGGGSPAGIIRGKAPQTMAELLKNSEWMAIFIPDHQIRDQAMISAGVNTVLGNLYIKIGGSKQAAPSGESPIVEVFRHKETFEANYRIELYKYCAETGETLPHSTFEVMEAFDGSQLGNGNAGTVAENRMSPRPAVWSGWRICSQVVTDQHGRADHSDRKFYYYNKTYCNGHPEPEYLEIPELIRDEETGLVLNQEEIDSAESENQRLQDEWAALAELCEQETDFHQIEPDEARREMIADRDQTYETFINLEYQYSVKEKAARPGYIVHGNHNDDMEIEVITTNSSEGGANTVVALAGVERSGKELQQSDKNHRRQLSGTQKKGSLAVLQSVLPVISPIDLDDRRSITNSFQLKFQKETPSNARAADTTKQSAKIKHALKDLFKATPSEAKTNDGANSDYNINPKDWKAGQHWGNQGEDRYQYQLKPLSSPAALDKPGRSKVAAPESLLQKIVNIFSREDHLPELPVSLPEPELDSVVSVIPGVSGSISYTFRVENHRTEGEIHINKRDLELYEENEAQSDASTQGDGTLEGAVYGLFAATDLIHPDGKTGIVYAASDLVAIATTDRNGDASFLVFTEESDTSIDKMNRDGTWIGHPLLLGSYYVKELSRSEGYELSVTGIHLTESNRLGGAEGTYIQSGEVSASGLSHRIDEQDGSWNETTISYYKTEQGFDVVISGYPENSEIYEVTVAEVERTENVVIASQLVPKIDHLGNPVYQTAAGGELKRDVSGNPIAMGGDDPENPMTETWYTYYRAGWYPAGTATPQIDPDKWADSTAIDGIYLKDEVNDMLSQLGYRMLPLDAGAPWITIELTGGTNEAMGTEILDWYTENNFFNCAMIEAVYEDSGVWRARLFYDYQGQSGASIYDALNGVLYIKKPLPVAEGETASHGWISYPSGTYHLNGFYAVVSPKKQYEGVVSFGDDIGNYLVEKFQPFYERYTAGEVLLDLTGNPIPEMTWQYTYGDVTETVREEYLTPIVADYDPIAGTYTFHVENIIDWTMITERQKVTYRIQAPETSITIDGKTIDYADYLVQMAGAGVSAAAVGATLDQGSYLKFQQLNYPGQIKVFQDGGTRENPLIVLQRVIKQSIRVTKDISRESYERYNTYSIHRDPFTVLFGGFSGPGKKYIADFHFKLYLVSDLTRAGLLSAESDGTYDYQKLFSDENKRREFDQYALEWDRPELDLDGDLTTLHASEGNGGEPYYGRSVMLPYGTYIIVEQIPRDLVNKHYELDNPKEVVLPFVPDIGQDGTIHEDIPSAEFLYFASYTPEELMNKFLIRFNEEQHVIQAHNHDGDFEVYKYGLDPDLMPDSYGNAVVGMRYRYGQSEDAGSADQVYYDLLYDQDGNVVDYGVTLNEVRTMTGASTAINGKYAHALVPWTIVDPRYGEVINENGDIGNRGPGLVNGSFNFTAFAKKHFENMFYSSKLRVEKLDAKTGENIIHDGAIFKIYAASRNVVGQGATSVTGTGQVKFETMIVTGTRPELEARGDVDNITWDMQNQIFTGTVVQPVYDESEQIFMLNQIGDEVGIFKAFSTEHPVVKADGTISQEKVGYIETYQPLGAGVYVLVEVQAPVGYHKSKPIAFEIYKDQVAYYPGGDPAGRTISERYQYMEPIGSGNSITYQDIAQITVTDTPSQLYIHKVEDGSKTVGEANGLGELSNVNDSGDLLTYIVRGRREYLEARGDVRNIAWDAFHSEYWGTVTKTFDEWSEHIVAGTESELLDMPDVKPLYELGSGSFSGYGIRFGIYVHHAVMSLYEGLQVERSGLNSYQGIQVKREHGKVVSITATETGNHLEIRNNERDTIPPYYPVWDTEKIDNEPIQLYFYDLDQVVTEVDQTTGELWVLNESGNRICYADALSGMAYIYDDYGNLIVYRAVGGEKVLAQSIEVHDSQNGEHIYLNIHTENDQMGLPLYYESGEVSYRPERWVTTGQAHKIERLPFGAYILEETEVPYEQGYIKVPDMGLILRESGEDQHFYFQNIFTKLNLAKVDVTTKAEIRDAGMTLYTAKRVTDESDRGYHLEKGTVYTSWISGYQYDDAGNLKLDADGARVPTTKPHWIDHIPVGDYILEETIVPYDQGYVQSESIEVLVTDHGNVQTGVMEDDYTGLEIIKYDTKTGAVLDADHPARLALYQADLDQEGKPLFKADQVLAGREIPVYQEENLIVSWWTGDGREVAATGREVTDEYGNTSICYEYNQIPIPATKKGCYYITERGSTMFHYLPVGYYVLIEEETPEGYATAGASVIEITDTGHLVNIHEYQMPDYPLTVEVSKVAVSGGKEVKDAFLQIYRIDGKGQREGQALYEWYSGSDGVYDEADREAGVIPEGLEIGDLKPHRIEYIPLGDYILVETMTPYGFLQSVDIPFTVIDTQAIQYVEVIDEVPKGLLEIVKRDSELNDWLLEQAVFEFRNKTLDLLVGTLTTDQTGRATASNAVPIGFLNQEGKFEPYTYEVIEVAAPASHMLNRTPFELQFEYQDQFTSLVSVTYDAVNDLNQVKISKKELTTREELPGAELTVTEKYTGQIVDHWISTGQPHYIKGILPGEYILTEIAVPGSGYAKAEQMEFAITENMEIIPYLEMYDDHTKIEIIKKDGLTNELLTGAKLQLEQLDGTILHQWTTTAEAYSINGLAPGQYLLREIQAPLGYQIGAAVMITIQDQLELQSFIYRNYRVKSPGGSHKHPEKPELPLKIGEISASYSPDLTDGTNAGKEGLPSLGDWLRNTDAIPWFFVGFLAMISCMAVICRKKKGWKKKGMLILLAVGLSCAWLLEIRADSQQPGAVHDMPIKSIWEECRVQYERVEDIRMIPADYLVMHEQSGLTKNCPTEQITPIGEYWSDTFSFSITLRSYDAAFYYLGDQLVKAGGDQTDWLISYEQQLLTQLRLDPERYQITDIQWAGPPYLGEQGDLCRDAVASGKKILGDYLVTYGDYFLIPKYFGDQPDGSGPLAVQHLLEREAPVAVSSKNQEKMERKIELNDIVEAEENHDFLIKRVIVISMIFLLGVIGIALVLWIIQKRCAISLTKERRESIMRGNKE